MAASALVLGALFVAGSGPASAAPTAVTVSGPWGVTVDPVTDTAYAVSQTGK